jgi:NarL family two-component system response regulator LiaR
MTRVDAYPQSQDYAVPIDDEILVAIADDHELVRAGIRQALRASEGIRVVGECADGLAALSFLETHHVDVLLLDVRMPRLDGISCLATIAEHWPDLSVLMLSVDDCEATVRECLSRGARGYITKGIRLSDLAATIRQAAAGTVILGGPRLVGAAAGDRCAGADLTPREHEILCHVAQGKTNTEIAKGLVLTTKTVKYHLTNLYAKLGVSNRTEAAAYAYRHRLVD